MFFFFSIDKQRSVMETGPLNNRTERSVVGCRECGAILYLFARAHLVTLVGALSRLVFFLVLYSVRRIDTALQTSWRSVLEIQSCVS